MRRLVLVALLLMSLAAVAAQKSVNFPRGTVSLGDSVQTMLKVAGKPHAILPPGKSPPGFKVYEYLTPTENIRFTVANGKVVGLGIGRR